MGQAFPLHEACERALDGPKMLLNTYLIYDVINEIP